MTQDSSPFKPKKPIVDQKFKTLYNIRCLGYQAGDREEIYRL